MRRFQRDATLRAASSSTEVETRFKMIVLVPSTNAQVVPTSPDRALSIRKLPNISSFQTMCEPPRFTHMNSELTNASSTCPTMAECEH